MKSYLAKQKHIRQSSNTLLAQKQYELELIQSVYNALNHIQKLCNKKI